MDQLQRWEEDWQMSFTPTKCEVVRITRKSNPIHSSYSIYGHDLSSVKSGGYLGVAISDNLAWNAHVDVTTKNANKSLTFLRRNLV